MKLHTFDSCPFCTRVKAFAGLKNIELEIVTFPLGELDPDVSAQLDTFSVPVLEMIDPEKSTSQVMTESLDILAYLDSLPAPGHLQPIFESYEISAQVEQWLADLRPLTAKLLYPRMARANLPELATKNAMNMFIQSREEYLGATLESLLAATNNFLPDLETKLIEIANEMAMNALVTSARKITIDDIALFAELRNLSLIGELSMPKLMTDYTTFIAAQAKVDLYAPIYA